VLKSVAPQNAISFFFKGNRKENKRGHLSRRSHYATKMEKDIMGLMVAGVFSRCAFCNWVVCRK
jgi:hypothetical protein